MRRRDWTDAGPRLPAQRCYSVFVIAAGQTAALSTISAAFSPIMIDGALVLPDVSVGMIEASATRRPAMPWTRSWASTTAIGSDPHLAGADRVVGGGFCRLLHQVEDFVIGGPT